MTPDQMKAQTDKKLREGAESMIQDFKKAVELGLGVTPTLEDFSEWVAIKTDQALDNGDIVSANHYASIQHTIQEFGKEQSK